MNWVVSQKMPIFHFIIWRSTQENSPLFPSHVIWWGATAESIMTCWKMRMMRRFFTTLNLKVCGLFVHPLTPFASETEYKRLISVKKFVVNLVLQYFCKMLPMEKETLCYRMGFTQFFLLAVKNHVPWVSLLFSVTIRDCCWGIKTFPGDFVLVSYNIGDGRKTQSLVVLSSRGLFRTSWVFVHTHK